MPSSNYKLIESARDDLVNHARNMLDRMVMLQQTLFPLNVREVYEGTTSSEDREAFAFLIQEHYYISKSSGMNMLVSGEDIHGVGNIRVYSNTNNFFTRTGNFVPTFNLDTLPADKREVFVEWANTALRQFRIARAANKIVREFVMQHCGDSLASMRTRWPGIMAVPLNMANRWPERVRNLTRVRRSEYGWSSHEEETYAWYIDHMDRLPVISGLLAGAQFLEVPEASFVIRVTVVDWTPSATS